MINLIKDLGPIRSGHCCDGLDQVCERLKEELPFEVHEFASGLECNGWIVPQKWECTKATIHNQAGELIYDGNAHPLGVCQYSQSWIGGLGGAELKKHLYYSEAFDDALIYHCDWTYKPHIKDWGFSVTKQFYDGIGDRDAYHVELRTTFEPGTMKVLEYVLPGDTKDSIVLSAHNCHPGCANDDLSGIAVGIEVMRELAKVPKRRYTYRLIVAPEHYGAVFYLQRFGKGSIKYALFLESLGSSGPLALQESFEAKSLFNRAMINAMPQDEERAIGISDYRSSITTWVHWKNRHKFRRLVGNCETVWEAAGYEIPCPSLSRVPFQEYHTSRDNWELMDEAKLEEAVRTVLDGMHIMENEAYPFRRFEGLVCLSNPKYDLYKPMMDPSIPGRRSISPQAREWNYLMDCLPRYFGREPQAGLSVLEIAEKHGLPFKQVWEYLKEWEGKGLVRLMRSYA